MCCSVTAGASTTGNRQPPGQRGFQRSGQGMGHQGEYCIDMLGEGGIGGKGSVCVWGGGGSVGYMQYSTTVGNLGGGVGGKGGGELCITWEGGAGSVGYMQYSTTVHNRGWGGGVGGGQAGNYGIGAVLHNSVVLLVFSAETVLRVLCWV